MNIIYNEQDVNNSNDLEGYIQPSPFLLESEEDDYYDNNPKAYDFPGRYFFASSEKIKHSKGLEYADNKSWWYDSCQHNDGFTCYGPYVTLRPGKYYASWYIETGPLKRGVLTDLSVNFYIDVVSNFGKNDLAYRPLYVGGVGTDEFKKIYTLEDRVFGDFGCEFRITEKTPYVEVRLKGTRGCEYLIAKYLQIVRLGD